jgi:hypothetical protein
LSDRLDKLEAENFSVTEFQFGLTDDEFEKLSLMWTKPLSNSIGL